jgi:predicted nucleic acid-binding protein
VTGVVFDTGALIAVDRGDRAIAVLLAEARRTATPITVPAGCVAQAWRSPARQARLAVLLRQRHVEVVPLDDEDARRVGLLLAANSTSDVVDGHVALCALRSRRSVLTSDPGDIRRLAPGAAIRQV